MLKLPNFLIAHPWMGFGGSEATAMWTLDTLQNLGNVTFTTASDIDWAALNATYGTTVDPKKIRIIQAPRIPTVRTGTQLVDLQNSFFTRHCRQLANDFDYCISTYNVIDFGRPSFQLIGDFSWSEQLRRAIYPNAGTHFKHRHSLLRTLYLKIGERLRGTSAPLIERGDQILANSEWSQQILQRNFGIKTDILYPPVLLPVEPDASINRDSMAFVCVGRISPEKAIETNIEILDQLRNLGHNVTLNIAGAGGDSSYVKKIDALIAERDWITPHGFLNSDQLEALLRRCSFGIHGSVIEAFGIAIAEMAANGCVPIVPASGGGIEIVTNPQLHYDSVEQAVAKIELLLQDAQRAESLRKATLLDVQRFSPEQFSKRLRSFIFPHQSATAHGTREQASFAAQ